MIDLDRALEFVRTQGNALDRVRLQAFRHEAFDPEPALKDFVKYQNEDGGWAHGLEPDYTGTISTVSTSVQAIRMLCELGLTSHPVFLRTVSFITIMQRSDGAWDEDAILYAHKAPKRLWPTRRWTVWSATVDAIAGLIRGGFGDSREVEWSRKFLASDEDLVEEIWGQGLTYPALGLIVFGTTIAPRAWEFNRCQQIIAAWLHSGEDVIPDLPLLADVLAQIGLTAGTGPFEETKARLEAAQQPDGGWLAPARWHRADATLVVLRFLKAVGAVAK